MLGIWAAILAFFAVQLLIGYWASKKIAGETDFLVAGRSLGLVMVSGSLFATWFGAETVMGSAAAIADKGLSGGRADPFGYTLCLIGMAFLIAYRMRTKGYVTLGDFFGDRYGRTVEILAVCILVPTSIFWSAAQILAFGQIIVVVSDVNIDVALVVSLVLMTTYMVMGGMLSDVVTDLLQGTILLVGLIVLLVVVVMAVGGVGPAIDSVRPEQLSFIDPDEGPWARLDAWFIPVVGSLVAQEAISRFLAARDAATAKKGCFVASGIYFAVGLIPVAIALLGANMDLGLDHRDEFLPTMAQKMLPTALFVIFIGALVSAILSTVNSTLLAPAGLIIRNIIDPLRPEATDKQRLLSVRVIVVLAAVTAYAVARGGDTIYDLVQASSSFGTAGIVVTVVFGLWTDKGGPITAVATLAAGVLGTYLGGESVLAVEAPFLMSLAMALVAFFVVGMFEGRHRREQMAA